MTLSAGPERDLVHLRVLLDQQQQRADVFSAEGLPLASVQVKSDAPKVLPGVCLEHKRGGLRFERLRVWSWTGSLPKSLAIDRPQLHRVDGSVVEGTLTAYDAARRQFTMAAADSQLRCSEDEMARIYFGEPDEPKDRPLRVSCVDGTLLSGWFAGIDGERLSLDCLSIDAPALESPSLPVSALAGIAFTYAESGEIPNRALVLRFDGGRMRGHLAPGKAEAGQSAVAWMPAGASQAAPLRDDASAQIVAQSLARFGGAPAGQPVAPRTLSNLIPVPTVPRNPSNDVAQHELKNAAAVGYDTIYLPTGDTFKCQIIGIDERGVRCRTASAEKQIPHNYVKAIDLAGSTGGASWARAADQLARQQRLPSQAAPNVNPAKPSTPDREKIARLLTLPRLNRDDPPAHILCATNGDYLRGRLLSMSESSLRFAVGESEREFPRERIAAIVWLHFDQSDDLSVDLSVNPPLSASDLVDGAAEAASSDPAVEPSDLTDEKVSPINLAHAVCTDGTRLTFTVTEIDGDVIAGVSEILGDCQFPLDRLTELLLGDRVRQAASQMAYHDWSLTQAIEPKAFQAGDQTDAGAESPLIGQAAPDFELELVDGSKFRLSQQKGRAVVLDFWASWCAPCVRTLPKLSRAVAELESSNAMLVAVNLRESADEAKAALARMNLDVKVCLDRD
ncbi:MAG: TlpA family protein disulfide reductase, partial [Pirellulales bacterium]